MSNKKWISFSIVLLSLALLSACGITGSFATKNAQGQSLFSDNKELDYTSPQTDYRFGASDLLEVRVLDAEEVSGEVRISPRGYISLPLIGEMRAEGLTQTQLENQITARLKQKYLQNPQVSLFIKEYTAQRVTVEGEVQKAGVFPIKGDLTLLQAVALSGGLNNLADPTKTVLFRRSNKQNKAYLLDLNAIRAGTARDPYVKNDDRIIVHRSNSRYWLKEVGTLLSPIRVLQSF
ncbi:MAG: polysaccharide biosynthesis/export family protein [bacterium]